MASLRVIPLDPTGDQPLGHVSALVQSLGEADFPKQLGAYLHGICGSVLTGGYKFRNGKPSTVAAAGMANADLAATDARRYVDDEHWRHDPVVAAAQEQCQEAQAVLVRANPREISDPVLQSKFYRPAGIVDKLALFAKRDGSSYCLSMMHTDGSGCFDDDSVHRIAVAADFIISILRKHADLRTHTWEPHKDSLASTSLVEERLKQADLGLTQRQRQVCARILRGIGGPGIALDLEISPDSVATYRKRAYQRLGIATQHELMRVYLKL